MEIPGFYYDPDRKRYFRLLPGNNRSNPLTSEDVKRKKAQKDAQNLKVVHGTDSLFVPRAVALQEVNNIRAYSGYDLQECVLHGRLKNVRKTNEIELDLLNFKGNEMKNAQCEYLIGTPENNMLIGAWRNEDGYILERVDISKAIDPNFKKFGPQDKSIVNAFPPGNKIIDFEADGHNSEYDVVMCLTNHLKPESTFSSLSIYFESRSVERALFIADHNLNFEFHEILYSCSGVLPHTFAIGGKNVIRLFKPFGSRDNNPRPSFDDHTSFKIRGIVSSLKFDNTGGSFFAGTNKGSFHRYDVNRKKEIQKLMTNNKSIVYLHPLSDNNRVILGCHENKLQMFDLRMLTHPVLSFDGYVNDCKKVPVSVDESIDVMCCKGQDSVVRMWSLKSGKPLCNIIPEAGTDANCSWFSQSWKCLSQQPKPVLFSAYGDKLVVHS